MITLFSIKYLKHKRSYIFKLIQKSNFFLLTLIENQLMNIKVNLLRQKNPILRNPFFISEKFSGSRATRIFPLIDEYPFFSPLQEA